MEKRIEKIKVKTSSKPKSVATAISKLMKEGADSVEITVIGAGALNQAIKAVTIARGFVASVGLNLVVTPSFAEVEIEENIKTAIKLVVENK